MDFMITILPWIALSPIPLFAIVSTVLFIKDGKDSKKERRRRTTVYTVMFIVSISILGLAIIFGTFLYILTDLFMRSM